MPRISFDFAKPLLSILFVVAVWQFAHAAGFTNRNLFPGPWEVAVASVKLFTDGVMMKDLKIITALLAKAGDSDDDEDEFPNE